MSREWTSVACQLSEPRGCQRQLRGISKATIIHRKIKDPRSAAKQLRTLKKNYTGARQKKEREREKEHILNTHN